MTTEKLTTIECSLPGQRYTLFESGPSLTVHLAGPGRTGGTGPCICGFDRFAKEVGFSVGGGTTGPGVKHDVCADCARLAAGRPVGGLHAELFVAVEG
jgi:hypothetical protein